MLRANCKIVPAKRREVTRISMHHESLWLCMLCFRSFGARMLPNTYVNM